jgi:hypothetical protein
VGAGLPVGRALAGDSGGSPWAPATLGRPRRRGRPTSWARDRSSTARARRSLRALERSRGCCRARSTGCTCRTI